MKRSDCEKASHSNRSIQKQERSPVVSSYRSPCPIRQKSPLDGKELFLRVFLQTIQKENKAKESEYSRASIMRDRMMGRSKKLKEFQQLIHRTDENRNRDLQKQTEGVQLENDNLAIELTKLQIQIKTAKEDIQQIINQDESMREYLDTHSCLSADQTFSLILSRTYFKGRNGLHLRNDLPKGRADPKLLLSPSSQEASIQASSKSLLDHQPQYLFDRKPSRNLKAEKNLSVSNNRAREDSYLLSQNISLTGSSKMADKHSPTISSNFAKKPYPGANNITAFSLNISNLGMRHRKSLEALASPHFLKLQSRDTEVRKHEQSPRDPKRMFESKKSEGCMAAEKLMKRFKELGNKKFGELSMGISARLGQLNAMMDKTRKEIDKQMKNSRKAGILALNVMLAFKKAFYVLKYYESLQLSKVDDPGLLSAKKQRIQSNSEFSRTHQLLHQLSLDFISDLKRLETRVSAAQNSPHETAKEPSFQSPLPLQKKVSPSTSTNPRSIKFTETCSKDETILQSKKGKELEVIKEHQKSPKASFDKKVFNVSSL
jgi:hypothetical protein